MKEIIRNLPKIELHAHLNGSLCANSIQELENALQKSETSVGLVQTASAADLIVLHEKRSFTECFKTFAHMHRLTATPFGLKLATQLIIRDFALDNVIYLELRSTAKDNEYMKKKQYLVTVLEAIESAKEVKNAQIRVKLLPSFNRANTIREAEEILEIVLELQKSEYADLIAGIDFSGDPTKSHFKHFIPVLTRAREQGLPLALHCCEIQNYEEVELMIEFGMQRCGHGTFLTEKQRKRLAEQQVPIECCLTSNVIGSTVNSYEDHHFKEIFLSQGPVVLCTDDCGVFNTTLTKELMIAVQTFQLDLRDIKKICQNSIEHAFIETKEKTLFQQKVTAFFENL